MTEEQNEDRPQPQPRPTLDYRHGSTTAESSPGRRVAMFIGGLFAGICISAVADGAALVTVGKSGLLVIPVVIGAKIYWAMQLKKSPSMRGFGSGLITSIGLLVLLVGACFGLLANMKF